MPVMSRDMEVAAATDRTYGCERQCTFDCIPYDVRRRDLYLHVSVSGKVGHQRREEPERVPKRHRHSVIPGGGRYRCLSACVKE